MSSRPSLSHARRLAADFRAGLGAAVIGLPQEINHGLLAVAPLGAVVAGKGIAFALYGAALAVLISLALGGGLGRISGPRPILSILMAGLFAALLQQPGFSLAQAPLFAAGTVFLAGLLLVAAAGLGVGRLIKYVPVPVLSGFTNGVAGMLVLSALPAALGLGLHPGPLADSLPRWQPAALAVTGVTVWFSVHSLRRFGLRHVPGIVQSLVLAWLTGLLLAAFGLSAGPALAELAAALPGPEELLGSPAIPALSLAQLGIVVKFALAIAFTAALETLVTSASLDARFGQRSAGEQDLRRLGWTMLGLSPLGMPVAGSLGRSVALLSAGAASRASHLFYVACLLALALAAYALVAALPQAVIAGILMVVARNMVGQSLHQAVAEIRQAQDRLQRRRSAADLAVMLLVALVTMLDSFITGLAAGTVAAMALFIRDQSRSVIRRVQFGSHCHSLRLRSPAARSLQLAHGREIAVIEAEGALFFGSAERLAREMESRCADAVEIIVDLRRVSDIDATAVHLLARIARQLRESGRQLRLSHLPRGGRLHAALLARGLAVEIPPEHWYGDLDSALESAESRLLARHGLDEDAARLPLSRSHLAGGLGAEQLAALEACCRPRRFQVGEALFRQGEASRSLYIITRGAVSIHVPDKGGGNRRIVAFGPGTVVGEMALLTGAPRSADALADEETELLELDSEALHRLERELPAIASALLRSLAAILAGRLRDTTQQLQAMAEI